jgi:hypothetical protein
MVALAVMSSTSRPPPTKDATMLSSLAGKPMAEQPSIATYPYPLPRRQTAPARPSGWNRQSVLLFADFNKFESPKGSRAHQTAEREDESDYGSPQNSPSDDRRFSRASADSLDKKLPEPPYHVFSLVKKKQMVYIVSLAGLFSPLSSNIYFPALGQISKVSKTSMNVGQDLTGDRISM